MSKASEKVLRIAGIQCLVCESVAGRVAAATVNPSQPLRKAAVNSLRIAHRLDATP
jgi:hypothetical protein